MKLIHERNLIVNSTWTDVNINMGLLPTLAVVQDNMCEYFKLLGCDGLTMVPACDCFLVVTKNKIHFNDFIQWLDEFKITSEISGLTRIKLLLETNITNKDGKVIATCEQEMCAMDNTLRKIRMLDTTLVPKDLEVTKEQLLNFERMSFDLSEENFVENRDVKVVNLDFYKHTNNIEYVRMMLSLVDLKFLEENIITDFEIHYISESKFGDVLELYKQIEEDKICFEIKKDGKALTKAMLKYEKK